jgi:hypothetical protein
MKKLLTYLTAAFVLTLGVVVSAVPHVSAATTLKICNSSISANYIKAYNDSRHEEHYIAPDHCDTVYNGDGNARVDVDPYDRPVGDYIKDIDSYKLGVIGEGYGPCHEDSENNASDPPNTAPDGVRYRNYVNSTCFG